MTTEVIQQGCVEPSDEALEELASPEMAARFPWTLIWFGRVATDCGWTG